MSISTTIFNETFKIKLLYLCNCRFVADDCFRISTDILHGGPKTCHLFDHIFSDLRLTE